MLRRLAVLALVLAAPTLAHASRVKDAGRGARSASAKKATKKAQPAVEMHHLSTGEHFTLRPDPGGSLGKKQLKGLRHFLRCHHTGREHAMNSHLAELLYKTARHFGDREITVIAGYRAPRVAREKGNPRSPHKRGVACDFRIAGVDNQTLRDYLRNTFHGVGVGYYPNSGFIHLDVDRKQNAFWIDYSAPGERAEYSRSPDEDLRTGRVDERRRPAPGAAELPEGVEPGEDDAPFADDPGLAGMLVPPPPPAAAAATP